MDFPTLCKNGTLDEVTKMYSTLGFFSRGKLAKQGMQLAVINGNIPVVQFLNMKKIRIEYNSLCVAVHQNQIPMLEWVIPSLTHNELMGLFDSSIQYNRIDISKLILPRITSILKNTVDTICKRGYFIQMKMVIEWGYMPNRFDGQMLRSASAHGDLEMVEYLFQKGANIRVMKDAPLRLACLNGHYEVVKFLVQNGADASNSQAMKHAIDKHFSEIANYLYENGDYTEYKFDVIAMRNMLKE